MAFGLPFPLRDAKLSTLSGQDLVKYRELAENPVFADWHKLFVSTLGQGSAEEAASGGRFSLPPYLIDNDCGMIHCEHILLRAQVASLHEKLRRYDLQRIGCVEAQGFSQALKLEGLPLSSESAYALFRDCDVRSLGKVIDPRFNCHIPVLPC